MAGQPSFVAVDRAFIGWRFVVGEGAQEVRGWRLTRAGVKRALKHRVTRIDLTAQHSAEKAQERPTNVA